jgi:hypothetical protein
MVFEIFNSHKLQKIKKKSPDFCTLFKVGGKIYRRLVGFFKNNNFIVSHRQNLAKS